MTPDGGVLPGDRYCMFALLPCTRPPSNRVTRTNLGSRKELAQPVVVQSASAVESLPSTRLPATHAVAVTRRGGPGGRVAVRDAAVRRIAAQVSGQPDLGQVFQDVLHHAMELFEIEGAGLWTLEDGERPFRLAAEHGLAPALIEAISGPMPTPLAGMIVDIRPLRLMTE